MYNNKLRLVHLEEVSYGVLVVTTAVGKFRNRKSRCMTLRQFREKNVPRTGLWVHYFSCPRCSWERVEPKLAICRYCDIPMKEIGSPGRFLREVNGVSIYRLRKDLLLKAISMYEEAEKVIPKTVGVTSGGITLLHIDAKQLYPKQ